MRVAPRKQGRAVAQRRSRKSPANLLHLRVIGPMVFVTVDRFACSCAVRGWVALGRCDLPAVRGGVLRHSSMRLGWRQRTGDRLAR
jgi:hypothetical protein